MRLHSPIPSTRAPSASWSLLQHIHLLTALFQPIKALSYPTTIEIDLLFPLPNRTYSDITAFPVIFALQNIPAADEFGYTLSWDLRSDDDNSTVALGTLYKMTYRNNSDSFLLDDGHVAILPDTVHNGTRLKSGPYSLKWKYSMVTCARNGDRTRYNIGGTQASNIHSFRIDEGEEHETQEVEMGLDKECPAFGDLVVVKDATKGGCPVMAGSGAKDDKEKRDPCRAKLNAQQASCIQGNVTGNYNESLCRKAFWSGGDKGASENGASYMAKISGMLGLVGLITGLVLL